MKIACVLSLRAASPTTSTRSYASRSGSYETAKSPHIPRDAVPHAHASQRYENSTMCEPFGSVTDSTFPQS